MKTKLLHAACLVLFGMYSSQLTAQEYQPIGIQSGFNADVIANGIGSSSTSTNNDVDGVNYAFISRDFQLTSSSTCLTYGLPIDGIINSAVGTTSGLSYQMAPYSSNNSLRLGNTNDAGTLVFSNPVSALSLYMLATGGSGACTVNATVNFTDTTTQTFSGISISDWYGGSNYAVQGIGRINLSNDGLESGSGTNPRLYQIPLAIDVANQSKTIQSVTVTKSGTGGIANIFAFSGNLYSSCAVPTNITNTSTINSAVVSWTAPASAPSVGYQYYLSTSSTPPTATTVPTGSVPAGTTSVPLNNLITGQTYYFWIRSNCGSVQGFWKLKQFTVGEMSTTYTAGDISTMYDSSPGTSSATNCAGTLTVAVPSGYKIKSTNVSYTMTTAGNGWMSEQKSLLVCSTNNATEAAVTSGSGGNTGTYSYNRTGLHLADGLTGNVNFELRAWRTYGGSDCGADYNKVDNNSLKITVVLEPLVLGVNEVSKEKERLAYPNPFKDILYLEKSETVKHAAITDLSGVTVKNIDTPSSSLNLEGVKTGVYILTLTMKDGSVKSSKVIKK